MAARERGTQVFTDVCLTADKRCRMNPGIIGLKTMIYTAQKDKGTLETEQSSTVRWT